MLGADSAGEANLTYSWTVVGSSPGGVTFSSNGTNTSKSTTAQLTQAGKYTFQVTITNASTGLSVTSVVTTTVSQVLTSVSVLPASAGVAINATKQFTATALDQFGLALTTQPTSFNWSVVGGGSISSTGLYTAPGNTGSATIQASVGAVTGMTSVSVISQSATTSTLTPAPFPISGATPFRR